MGPQGRRTIARRDERSRRVARQTSPWLGQGRGAANLGAFGGDDAIRSRGMDQYAPCGEQNSDALKKRHFGISRGGGGPLHSSTLTPRKITPGGKIYYFQKKGRPSCPRTKVREAAGRKKGGMLATAARCIFEAKGPKNLPGLFAHPHLRGPRVHRCTERAKEHFRGV